jgi:hypothetical protein
MATIMAQRLERVAQAGCIKAGDIPVGVSYDAKQFFILALEAARDERPTNPPASVQAYQIAADLVRASTDSLPNTRVDIGNRLDEYHRLLLSLQQPRLLTAEEPPTVRELQRFFDHLRAEGETESYEGGVLLEPVPVGLRSF